MTTKCSTISIIGKPNAGKSTLLNRIIGQKIAIVTPKVQTTRSMITGILTKNDTQLIFIDTPGIFNPKKKLEKAMVRCAWSSIVGVDHVIFLIDSTEGMTDDIKEILQRLKEKKIDPIIVLNKSDSAKSKDIDFDAKIFKISALDGRGVDELLNYLSEIATPKPWLYEILSLRNHT
jgi:GTP-binding protein Era